MVGDTQEQQSQPPQPQPPTTAVDEALKRNTDCVYFLASPLTCKKGGECDYRHSEIARVNPRDCWYWLNGNCLNPKCAFRHPPLDGLLGTQIPSPVGPYVLPPSQIAAMPAGHATYSSAKGVPCIFFQKGFCLKGDRCPFSHAPNSANNKPAQSAAATPFTESPTLKKTFGGLERCTQEQKVPQINVPKPVEVTRASVEATSARNGVAVDRNVPPPSGFDDALPRYRPLNVPPPSGLDDALPRYRPINAPLATNGNSNSRSNRVQQAHVLDDHSISNGRDADGFSREPSPGFDVLVDDELRDSDYYHDEHQFGDHEGRNLNSMNDSGRSADYNVMANVDRDMYRDHPHGYDSYERLQSQYAWDEHRASSERVSGSSTHLEKRRYPRAESLDRIDVPDLRHHLSKQRRGSNGLRSVISRDHARENHMEDRSYRASRETHHVSSRLRGRIKIPRRSTSPVSENDSHPERELDEGLSPGRSQISSYQGRLRDRIKGRVQEDFNNDGRNFRGPSMRRDVLNDNNDGRNFRGPNMRRDVLNDVDAGFTARRSLSELKVRKNTDSNLQHLDNHQSFGKKKYPKLESHQQSEGDLSFEGPKPLSEILKRKRGADAAVSDTGMIYGGNEENHQKERKESLMRTIVTRETKGILSSASKDSANHMHSNNEELKYVSSATGGAEEQSGLIPAVKFKTIDGKSSLQRTVCDPELEDGMIGDESMEDHETEAYYQREGDSDDGQVDGEDYNLEEGENADAEKEYLDDDDDADDFAKKMGVMYS